MKTIINTVKQWLFQNSVPDAGPEEARDEQPKRTVLVIDDDPALLQALKSLLADAGFTVLTSPNAMKGLLMAQYNSTVQLVVLDYQMPDLNGDDTLRYLRQLRPQLKVIGLSGVDTTALPESYRHGVNAHLSKPFNSGQLLSVIRHLLGLEPRLPVPASD